MLLNFSYSIESEADRVGYTLDKYAWYKENGYRINLPESLRERAERGESMSDEEILSAVTQDFRPNLYEKAEKKLSEEFEKIRAEFVPQLKTLGGPAHDAYEVLITRYGVGGSYGLPNRIQVNIDYGRELSWKTLAHEMVHLSIEQWIQEYKVPHWTKERLVDLTMSRFFPGEIKIQKSAEERADIKEIFETNFPDMKKVIEEVSRL